jgi:SAM-dependent methyltransferase
LILDIGCGVNPVGDVNVDLPFGGDYAKLKTKANVIESARNLPFRNGAFEVGFFNGLLHHLEDSDKAWKEILRVCSDVVIGNEPNFNLIFPRDKTEAYHTYRKGVLSGILGKGSDDRFDISVERVLRTHPPKD